jgi:hypothetical protein
MLGSLPEFKRGAKYLFQRIEQNHKPDQQIIAIYTQQLLQSIHMQI